MAAKTGSVVRAGLSGGLGIPRYVIGKLTLDAALATSNTYAIDSFFPAGNKKAISFEIIPEVELDTNATPTLSLAAGPGTGTTASDDDGFYDAVVAAYEGGNTFQNPGALIENGTTFSGEDLVLTVVANPATGATSGDIFFICWYEMAA